MSKESVDPKQKQYSKIGIVVTIIFVALVIILNIVKDNLSWKFYSIYIEMSKIGNLKEGSAVFNQGSQIGHVKGVATINETFLLHLKMKQKTRLPSAAIGQVLQDNYNKQDFVEIVVNDWESPLLMDGDTIAL